MIRARPTELCAMLAWLCCWTLTATAGMLPMSWQGELHGSGNHHATGRAVVSDGPFGAILALKELQVDPVPDGRVYLAHGGDHRSGIELGRLEQFSGDARYTIPASVDPSGFDSVVIWCEKFQVEIGRATLTESDM